MSEGHLRQMLVVGENAGKYINDYSENFKKDFLALLSRRFVISNCSSITFNLTTVAVFIDGEQNEF